MKYVRTKDGITTSDKATHELIENICDAGYGKILKKGACVRIDKEWFNYYGRWVDLIDENGCHYSIRPNEVERVTKELPQADTIEELCDAFVCFDNENECFLEEEYKDFIEMYIDMEKHCRLKKAYGIIFTDKGLIYMAKMNEKGELELL